MDEACWEAITRTLEPQTYRMIASNAGSWVSDWESASPDLIVLCGSRSTNQACRLVKLSSSLNRAGLLLCKAEQRVRKSDQREVAVGGQTTRT